MHRAGVCRRRRLALNKTAAKDWIGIDWGTTHRRAWRFVVDQAADQPAARHDDAQGLLAAAPHFARSLADLLHALGSDPQQATIVMAGMVGAASGWQEVPYVDAATPLHQLPQRLQRVMQPDAPVSAWIVPGVCWRGADGAVDVMRGEETQLLGALQLLGDRSDGWYLLPGTHSKWVQIAGGRVQWLRTYMSGELFALLRAHGTLAAVMQSGDDDGAPAPEAFARGVAASADAALSHLLFAARARVVTGALPREHSAAFVSGALLGAEWRDMARRLAPATAVRAIGDARLSALHARCAAQLGFAVEPLAAESVQDAAWSCLRKDGPQ